MKYKFNIGDKVIYKHKKVTIINLDYYTDYDGDDDEGRPIYRREPMYQIKYQDRLIYVFENDLKKEEVK